jgi:hypothetical protein
VSTFLRLLTFLAGRTGTHDKVRGSRTTKRSVGNIQNQGIQARLSIKDIYVSLVIRDRWASSQSLFGSKRRVYLSHSQTLDCFCKRVKASTCTKGGLVLDRSNLPAADIVSASDSTRQKKAWFDKQSGQLVSSGTLEEQTLSMRV